MDTQKINAVVDTNNAAVGRGNMAAVLATFERTGALVGRSGTVAQGMDALEGAFAGIMGMSPRSR